MKYYSASVLITLLILSGCGPAEQVADDPEPNENDRDEIEKTENLLSGIETGDDVQRLLNQEDGWVEETLQELSLEEKVAQMMMPRVYTHYIHRDTDQFQEIKEYVEDYGVGGLIISHGDVHEVAMLLDEFQSMADLPLLVSADFERGVTMRIRRATEFPVAMAKGAAGDPGLTYRMAKATAEEARALGVHYNFAPVVDVNNNPDNPVINVRSFGEDPEMVGEMAEAYNLGLHDGGVISTGKHFPGHGDTDLDSHVDLPEITHDRDRMEEIELKPFRHTIDKGMMSVMSAHIAMPELAESPEIPATLSRSIMTDLLRSDLNFAGLLVTDSMGMAGVTQQYANDEAAVKAVQAGVDIVLNPPEPITAIEAVTAAVRVGEIDEQEIDESVRRILSAKKTLGLHEDRHVDFNKIRDVINDPYHNELAEEIAQQSLTLVRNDDDMFPLDPDEDQTILNISLEDIDDQRINVHSPDMLAPSLPVRQFFNDGFSSKFGEMPTYNLDPQSNDEHIDSMMEKAEEADKILLHAYVTARSGAGELDIPDHIDKALQDLADLDTPMGVVSFGDPYFISGVPEIDAYMAAWSANKAAIEAAVQTLTGEQQPMGRLPIEIPDIGEIGDGLEYDPPEEE